MTHHKIILPSKICKVCGLSFNWRKKWKLNWNEVLYCSDRCRRNKPAKGENKSRTATTPLSVKHCIFTLTPSISQRIASLLERRGLLERDEDNSYLTLDSLDEDPMQGLHSHSLPRGLCAKQ